MTDLGCFSDLISHLSSGSFGGGALLSIQGSGFDPHNSTVTLCGGDCDVDRDMSTSTRLYCQSPSNNSEFSLPSLHLPR